MPLNINFQQVFLHMLNFALLFGAMYFLLYKPVKKFMDSRAQRYQKMDEDAKAALAQAEAAKAEYEKKLAGADDEIAQKRADEQDKLRLAQKAAEEIVEKSRAAAQKEHDAVMAKAQSEIADIVAAAAEKLVLQSTSEAYEQFLTAAEERSSDE